MRCCAIVNPAAGQGRVKRVWPKLLPEIRAATTELVVRKTSAPGEATTLTRGAVQETYDRILAVGGDGTVHEVVNGYFRPDGTPLPSAPPLVPLPCGSGTDFNRMMDGKTGVDAVSYLRSGRVRSVDLLRLEYTSRDGESATRYAHNVVSLGLSSAVVRAVRRGRPPLTGRFRYLSAAIRILFTEAPAEVTVTLDNEVAREGPVRLVAVANGHSFGAGIKIAPNAVVDDGLLDLTILRDTSVFRLLCSVPRFYTGTLASLDGISTHRARRTTIRPVSNEPVWGEAGGELIGQLPTTVTVVPSALRVQW